MIRQTMPDGFERCVHFVPAYDYRHTPGKEQYVDGAAGVVRPRARIHCGRFRLYWLDS